MTTKEKVLQRMIDLKLVINKSDGERWILETIIPSYGKTAAQLIQEGKTVELIEELERLCHGGYA